jgi:hypothetical protein
MAINIFFKGDFFLVLGGKKHTVLMGEGGLAVTSDNSPHLIDNTFIFINMFLFVCLVQLVDSCKRLLFVHN